MREFTALRIDVDSKIDLIKIKVEDFLQEKIKKYFVSKGYNNPTYIEHINFARNTLTAYSFTNGNVFNTFDLETKNVYGDILFIKIDYLQSPIDIIDIDINYIMDYYKGNLIKDEDDDDEDYIPEEDEYDFTDDFIELDEDYIKLYKS